MRERSMKVTLLVPCFVDQLLPQVGVAAVEVLERLGHRVECPEQFLCCGQPAYNSGFEAEAREVAAHVMDALGGADPVVMLSGSCASMIKVFYPRLFRGTPREEAARALAERAHEFSSFLVRVCGAGDVGARFPATVTFHDGCHGLRELGVRDEPRKLLRCVRDLRLVEMDEAETCCGFGGAFSVKFPAISTGMAEVKGRSIIATGAEAVVSNDPSCLLQIRGWLEKQGSPVKALHLAEVLAQR
jgi:L-lactate dehydrogenase complex protein LldE